jgi:hypothetical protein
MKPESQRFLTPSSRNDRRRRQQVGRRRVALVIALIVVAAAVFTWAIILPGTKKTPSSTSTTVRPTVSTSAASQGASSPTTLTNSGTGTTSSTLRSPAPGALTYSAQLSGQNEIPALLTSASGTLTLTVTANHASVHYVLSVSKITDLTVARLHQGKTGATGATILTLYGGPTKSGLFSGVLIQGNFTAADFTGPLQGKTMADFLTLLKSGSIYLNVGTTAHIPGEIRGQIR